MTMINYFRFLLFCSFGVLLSACNDNSNNSSIDTFDRELMLTHWADNIIIPRYETYVSSLEDLESKTEEFITNASVDNFDVLRSSWLSSYTAWQAVSMFEIGKAEENGLRNYTNIYPTDTNKINQNIAEHDYNLTLPSNFDAQGFPALDYLLYGLSEDKSEAAYLLTQSDRNLYLSLLVTRLKLLAEAVVDDWKSGYREEFIANKGSSATASVDKIVNDFLYYYERFLRAGKVGIPAGVFSGSSLSHTVEAPFCGVYSKDFLLASLTAVQDFFNGKSHLSNGTGESLNAYLDYLNTKIEGADLAVLINSQFDSARNKINSLNQNLKKQVETDNVKMLEAYDELQKVVILFKVDMMQALNIKVDFIDADGD